MAPKKQVSPAIRILRGERDASARAIHLEAATRKFLVTTNERKQMSTKTNFKRIALVAVASLGLGVLSSVPAKATIIGVPVLTAANGTATTQKSDTTTAASISVKFNATSARDSMVITISGITAPTGAATTTTQRVMQTASDTTTSTGAAPALSITNGITGATANWAKTPGTTSDSQVAVAKTDYTAIGGPSVVRAGGAGVVYAKFLYHLDTALVRTAGTYTIDYYTTVYSSPSTSLGDEVPGSAVFGQITIVVSDGTAAADGAVTAAGTSTALMKSGATWTTITVDDSVSAANTPSSSTPIAVIKVTQQTAAGLPSRESITVTTTIGNVGSTSAASGKTVTFLAGTNGVNEIGIFGDGTGGSAVITIKTTSVTFANKAVTFYGTTVATITTSVLASTIGSTSVNTILATAKDANGVNVRAANAVYAYSSDVNVINTGTSPAGTSCGTYNSTLGGYQCPLTGSNNGTANITVRDASTSTLSTVASSASAIKVNIAPAVKFTLAFNKATYAPGEVAYIIIKPLDSSGGAIGAATLTNLFAAGGITTTAAFGNGSVSADSLTAVTYDIASKLATDGVASTEAVALLKVYMPVSGGNVSISATGGTLLPSSGRVAVTASATVTDNGAAALAAVTALATTVASLKTLITTLTNLVLKIQKKVKA